MIGDILVNHNKSENIDLVSFNITGKQIDTLCNLKILQKFKNTNTDSVNCEYVFPNDSKYCIYDTILRANGKEIHPELREKKEAKREFDEAVKSGNTAILGSDYGNGTCTYSLGNINPQDNVEIEVQLSFLCQITLDGVSLKIPLTTSFQQGSITTERSKCSYFSLSLEIKQHSSNIEKVDCSVESKVENVDENTQNVSITTMPSDDAIFINTKLKDGGKSIAISSDGYTLVSSFPVVDFTDDLNSEYVFLVDCSGSMTGSRINNAKQCMNIFIHSLPNKCKFAIWRFGSSFECTVDSCDYNRENIQSAIEKISRINADLGGTEIYEPLKEIMNRKISDGFVRQIFILTDGEIDNTKDVIALASINRKLNRIFCVGLGSGADAGLINGLAEITNGVGIQVNDGNDLTKKVVDLLENAIQPAITNISLISDGMTEYWPSIIPTIYNQSYQHFIIKGPCQESVLLSGTLINDSFDEAVDVEKVEDCIGLKQLFMSKIIEELQYELREQEDDEKVAKIVQLSLEAKVLSEYTSYIGIETKTRHMYEDCCILEDCCVLDDCCDYCTQGSVAPSFNAVAKPQSLFKKVSNWFRNKTSNKKPDVCYDEPCSMSVEVDNIQEIIDSQNPDGSWSSFKDVDKSIVSKYNETVAATVAALAFINKNSGQRLQEFKLIIKKAYKFLQSVDKTVNWEEIVNNAI